MARSYESLRANVELAAHGMFIKSLDFRFQHL